MNKAILLTILSAVLIAGCAGGQLPIPWITSPTSLIGGNGLVITEFALDNTEIYSNRSAKVTMTVANKGGSTVPDANSLVVLQGSAIKPDLLDTLYWSGRSSTTDVYEKMAKDMNPYDPVRDIPADEKIINWYLTSPTGIAAGTTRSDIFIGRVYYDYSTIVTGNVWIYSESESEAAKAAGRSLNQNSFTSTSGPIALYVSVKPTNVVVSSTDNTITMQIKVSNVGGGTVYSTGGVDYTDPPASLVIDTETELNMVTVTVTAPGTWGGNIGDCSDTVQLVKGEATLNCDVTVPVPSTFESSQIKVDATYGYWTERTASITVSGK